jgi:uncharacterized protein (DUF58 family)
VTGLYTVDKDGVAGVMKNARKITIFSIPILFLALALLTGSILMLRLAFLSILIIGVSFLWVALSPRRFTAKFSPLPEHPQAGSGFQREIVITNTEKKPSLWLNVKDNTDVQEHLGTVLNIPGKSSELWKEDFSLKKRGLYHLGPLTLISSDPLGIFSSQYNLGEAQEIIVLPRTVDLPHLKFNPLPDFGSGSQYQSVSRISPSASSVREFASGDSLHHIHWPSTARSGNMMVKVFDAEHSLNSTRMAWVILDMNRESHYGLEDNASEELAVSIAASIFRKCIQSGMQVGLLASGGSRSPLMLGSGEEQVWQALETLALVKTDVKTSLKETASRYHDYFRDNPLIIVVATSATQHLAETIHQLRSRTGVILVVLLDIASWGGQPLSGSMSRNLSRNVSGMFIVRKNDDLAQVMDSRIQNQILKAGIK